MSIGDSINLQFSNKMFFVPALVVLNRGMFSFCEVSSTITDFCMVNALGGKIFRSTT